ncbi:NAD-dependent epimerase/dehydratase family protein [Bacteroides thetaiotaomicron]|uniref:NAD-dependent epimerase/dehydratase family protein n=1 Tax=Bacteroides thetaiotaomicron TaxID=818 RepID=A0A174RL96_BACT4|nr:NAD-dependent epimerase/dehydratase family protein [Bacteroides thetaiotaomicron]MBV4310681.1 NAD-dependent epimerase/dehydratase family protein [Bacteroides thetaiotaomicron]MBV4329581.1 NAD-dependent epimerase/dehydratase family protein [Bacteroides thetaiotaomicron]MCB7385554.1 NAD-dependent epimerase/dehydratase family protein [Bacteroides thetaiotaomicron]MCE9238141.1 NAD-dependent epimerase/dehydratase family protein [Bacteroides thetaiotaomicron]MCE9267811.1 NAD-dependent epimerase/d
MKRVLITGANSFVGINVEKWLLQTPSEFEVDTVDTMNEVWKKADFTKYDAVFHVAGIAHVDPKPEMASLYYKVNRDLTIEIAKWAKEHGVKQFIFMSSKIVYHTSKSLKGDVVTKNTKPRPNDFYGDSKLQAENKLKEFEASDFKVVLLRPCMIYGLGNKGNLPRLAWLATKTPIFPAWHNKRSMIHVHNLAELVRQVILRELNGTFHPQNKEYVDIVEVVRYFAKKYNNKVWITGLFNPLIWLGSFFLKPICKMFADSYYDQDISTYDFNYQVIKFEESLKDVEVKKDMK